MHNPELISWISYSSLTLCMLEKLVQSFKVKYFSTVILGKARKVQNERINWCAGGGGGLEHAVTGAGRLRRPAGRARGVAARGVHEQRRAGGEPVQRAEPARAAPRRAPARRRRRPGVAPRHQQDLQAQHLHLLQHRRRAASAVQSARQPVLVPLVLFGWFPTPIHHRETKVVRQLELLERFPFSLQSTTTQASLHCDRDAPYGFRP